VSGWFKVAILCYHNTSSAFEGLKDKWHGLCHHPPQEPFLWLPNMPTLPLKSPPITLSWECFQANCFKCRITALNVESIEKMKHPKLYLK
jgi:hypothetical protein